MASETIRCSLKQTRVNRSNNGNANSHAPSSSSSSSNCHFSKQQKRELEKEKSSISTDSSVNSVSGVTTTNGGGGGTNSSSKLSKVRNNEKCSRTIHIFNSLPFPPKLNPIQTEVGQSTKYFSLKEYQISGALTMLHQPLLRLEGFSSKNDTFH